VLRKDLLRVSRRGGGYQPEFIDESDDSLAARVIGCYQGHLGEQRQRLDAALTDIERESDDFKLVRGLAKLIDDDATWTVESPIAPAKARPVVFAESEAVGVVTDDEREQALTRAADRLDATVSAVEQSLYADRAQNEVLVDLERRWTPPELVEQYNLSLAQTTLFDAREVRIRSDDPKRVISAIKRLRLLYEVRQLPDDQRRTVAETDRELVVTGPDALFTRSRRYGTAFGRLLRTVAATGRWQLTATIDDRGTDRELVVGHGDLTVPDTEAVTEVSYDSDVERAFATRFESLDLDWELIREPDAVEAGEHVVIPDFALDWAHGDFRIYFEIMGFWTPEYVEKKLDRLDAVDGAMLVAVDESLGVGEEIELRDHRAIPYSGGVSVKDVRNALRVYEDDLVAAAAEDVPDALRPEQSVVTISELASEFGVSETVIEDKAFPDHDRIGRTLVEPAVLDDLAEQIEDGMSFEEVEAIVAETGIADASAALDAVGYRVAWEGLSGGTVREK
jgi:predicted nuclease of restriction endonuclease-like RecB superfamily